MNFSPIDKWPTEAPEAAGMDTEQLHGMDDIIRNQYKRIHSFLIVRNEKLVFERYYGGYTPGQTHRLRSVTKSILSALIGIAFDHKLINDVDQPILDFFPEYTPSARHMIKQSITVRHLLTMTSGFYSPERRGNQPLMGRMERSKHWIRFLLDLPIVPEKIDQFNYSDINSHLLSAILSRTTGMNASAFANKYLFGPLGIHNIIDISSEKDRPPDIPSWYTDSQGNNMGGSGLSIVARDLMRYGYLYLNRGRWGTQMILSPDWIVMSTTEQVRLNGTAGYGFHWWINEIAGYKMYHALGYGGQYLLNIPELNMVVAITSDDQSLPMLGRDPLSIVEQYVIPAIMDR